MSRRIGLVLFILFGFLTVSMATKEVTFLRGHDVDLRKGTAVAVYVYCGDLTSIVRDGEFPPDVNQYLYGPCRKAARSHIAWLIILSLGTAVSLWWWLTSPKLRDISVLRPLPTPEELALWELPSA